MITFDNFHHDLTELFKKSEKELGLKLEEDLEFDALKILTQKLLLWEWFKMD